MGPPAAFPTLPYDRALDGSGDVGVEGKLLLVGLSEPRQPEQQDDFISVFSQSTGVNLSGVELAATAVANLLEQRALASLPLPLQGALIVVLGIAFGSLVGAIDGAARGRRRGARRRSLFRGCVLAVRERLRLAPARRAAARAVAGELRRGGLVELSRARRAARARAHCARLLRSAVARAQAHASKRWRRAPTGSCCTARVS